LTEPTVNHRENEISRLHRKTENGDTRYQAHQYLQLEATRNLWDLNGVLPNIAEHDGIAITLLCPLFAAALALPMQRIIYPDAPVAIRLPFAD
jgi:hypothetical protein